MWSPGPWPAAKTLPAFADREKYVGFESDLGITTLWGSRNLIQLTLPRMQSYINAGMDAARKWTAFIMIIVIAAVCVVFIWWQK